MSDIGISRVTRGRITLIPPEVLQVTISKVRNFVGLLPSKTVLYGTFYTGRILVVTASVMASGPDLLILAGNLHFLKVIQCAEKMGGS